jgi:hypothetical protein
MKTSIIATVLLMTASLLIAGTKITSPSVSGDIVVLEEENYVNDIPFDTWKISGLAYPPDLTLNEESYVDDIPFNTAEIAREALLEKVIEQKEEGSVNDIPFNTNKIYNEIQLNRYISQWQDEKNVCDMPSSTCIIVSMTNCEGSYRIIINDDFLEGLEEYIEDFSIRIKGLETLSFGYPF